MTAFHWLVKDSPIESPWLRGTKTFGVNKPVMLIDQFGGKQPYLINQQYWEAGELSYPACAKAVVDSNLLDGIAALMSSAEIDDGLRGFIEFVSREGWDINAGFFLTEQYAKSTRANFLLHATRRLRMLYRFLAMDTDYFLATGTRSSRKGSMRKVRPMRNDAGTPIPSEISKVWGYGYSWVNSGIRSVCSIFAGNLRPSPQKLV